MPTMTIGGITRRSMSQLAVSATRQVTPVYARAESKRFCPSLRYSTGSRDGLSRPRRDPHRDPPRQPERRARDFKRFRRVRLSFCHQVSRYTSDTERTGAPPVNGPTISSCDSHLARGASPARHHGAPLGNHGPVRALHVRDGDRRVVCRHRPGDPHRRRRPRYTHSTSIRPAAPGNLPVTWEEAVRLALFGGLRRRHQPSC